MSFTWEPSIKPPHPSTISGLSPIAERVLSSIIRTSNSELHFSDDFSEAKYQSNNANNNGLKIPRELYTNENYTGSSTFSSTSLTNCKKDEEIKLGGKPRQNVLHPVRFEQSSLDDFIHSPVINLKESPISKHGKDRLFWYQNVTDKGKRYSPYPRPQEAISRATFALEQMKFKFKLFDIKSRQSMNKQNPLGNVYTGPDNPKTLYQKKNKIQKQLKIDDYFAPIKKQ